jgi:hypothetical protein
MSALLRPRDLAGRRRDSHALRNAYVTAVAVTDLDQGELAAFLHGYGFRRVRAGRGRRRRGEQHDRRTACPPNHSHNCPRFLAIARIAKLTASAKRRNPSLRWHCSAGRCCAGAAARTWSARPGHAASGEGHRGTAGGSDRHQGPFADGDAPLYREERRPAKARAARRRPRRASFG